MQAMPSTAVMERHDIVDRLVEPVERHDREDEREHEQSDAVADDVVAQQRGRDDARRQLASGDLDRDEQRPEGEDQERQGQGDGRLVERLRAGNAQPGQAPAEPRVQHTQRRAHDEHHENGEKGNRPERRSEVARGAIDVVPDERPLDSPREAAPGAGDLPGGEVEP